MKHEYRKAADITINTDRCLGCRHCMHFCTENVYEWDYEKDIPVVKHPEDCECCFLCETNCLGDCIKVKTLTGPGQYFDAFYR